MEGCESDIYYEYSAREWQLCKFEAVSEDSKSSISRHRSRYRLCAPCKNNTDGCTEGHPLRLVFYKDPASESQYSPFPLPGGNKHRFIFTDPDLR